MHRLKALHTVLFLAVAFGLYAQPLPLQQALDYAKQNNSTLTVAKLELEQALRKQETNLFLPSVSLELGVNATGSLIDSTLSSSFSAGSISIDLSSANKYTRQQQSLAKAISQSTYQTTENTVADNVITAYWNCVAAELSVTNAQTTVDQALRAYNLAVEKYEGGKATTLSVNQAKLTLSDAQYELQAAQQVADSCYNTLNYMIGQTGVWELDSMPSVSQTIPLESLLALVENTNTIKNLALAIDNAQLSQKIARNTYTSPTFSLGASIGFAGSVSNSTDFTINDETSLSLAVSIPLDAYLTNSAAQVALDTASMEIDIAQASYQKGLEELGESVKTAYTSLDQIKANLEKLEEHLVLANTQLDLVQAAYNASLSPYSDLKDSQDAVHSASLSILQQQLDYTLALYDLSNLLEVGLNTLIQ